MNNAYKLVYSTALNAWVAVAEHVRGRGKQGAVRLLTAAALLGGGLPGSGLAWAAPPTPLAALAPPAVNQLPTGAQVASGAVSFSQTQTATAASLAITQTSDKAIVNWQSFNVGANAKVNISQPNTSSVLLNRVQQANPSQIFGQINANGQVLLINPSGVYFAPGSSVDVGSFTASTHSISDSDFLAGKYNFNRNGATGSVINQGSIKAGLGGYIALLAPEVQNQGVVVAQMGGTVAMAAGESMQLQFNANNQLTNVLVTPATIQTLVDNGNAVQAPGGLIILSAQAAHGLLGGVVKNSGVISATGLVNDGGTIRLSASHKIELTPSSSITADAAANSAGKGGRIDIIADLSNASSSTQVDGSIGAKGGDMGGDGGFVETSAVNLNIADTARVSTLAPLGKVGTWLLDPEDFKVSDAGGNITPANLVTALNSSGVTITTTATTASCVNTSNISCGSGSAGNGDISIDSPITGWNANLLTLTAYRNVNINAAITGTGTSSLNVRSGTTGVINLNANIATGEAPAATVNGAVIREGQTYFHVASNGNFTTGAVVLGANVTLSTTNSDVVLQSTVDSSVGTNFALTVSNGSGRSKLLGDVGGSRALSSLSLGGSGAIILGGNVTTTGAQSYGGPVFLFAITSRDFLLQSNNANVDFLSTVDAADQNFGGETLTISNGSGNVNMVGAVGSILPLGYLTISGGTTTTAQTTTLGADVKTNNSQTYGGNVTLNSNLSLSTWQNGNVSIAGNVDTTVQSSLLFQFLGGGSYSYSSNSGASFVNYAAAGNSSYGASVIAGFGSLSYDSSGSGTYLWTPSSTMQASYLAIGGGGSGGGRTGGGGGAGGVLTGNAGFIAASPYSIVIGAGGVIPAAVAGSSQGVSGGSSTVSGSGVSVTALGGGGGGFNDATGRTGLAGGSGGGSSDRPSSGINTIGGAGTAGQGNNGGTSSSWGGNYGAGGGGGAGSVGQNGSDASGGTGGVGIVNPITGSTIGTSTAGMYYIAGGGGGGSFGPLTAGGLGGGGAATGDATTAVGVANTGGGGGGSKFNGSSSGAGGSGAVVINGSVNNQFSLSISTGSGKTSIGGSVVNVSDLSIDSTHADSQVTGVISGAANVTKSGAGGVLKLVGNNTYTGGTNLNGGALNLGSAGAIGSSGTISFGGGSLQFSASNTADYSARFSTLASQNYRIDTNSQNVTLATALTSAGGTLTKLGNGVLRLTGNNSYDGGSTVSAGTLQAGSASALGTGTVAVGSGAALDLNGQSVANAITLTSGASTGALINSSVTTATASGAIHLTAHSSVGGLGAITLSGAITSAGYGLAMLGSGAKTMSNIGNSLTTIATEAGVGNLSITNNTALAIGQVTTGGSTYSGINSTGTVSIFTRSGDLTVSQNVSTTSASANTSSPALKLSAGDGTAAGTVLGGNVVLSGSPVFSVGTDGIAAIYTGAVSGSTGVASNFGAKTTHYSRYNQSHADLPASGGGYYVMYRESPTIYLLADSGQHSTYGDAPALSYWYSSSATSVVPVTYVGIPTTVQTYSLTGGLVTNSIVVSGTSGSLALTGSPSISSGGLVTTTSVGIYALTLTPTVSLAGFQFLAGNAVDYLVSRKSVALTNTARSSTYDGVSSYATLAAGMAFTTSAMVGTDTVASVTQTASLSGTAQAGTFTVTPSAAVLSIGNANNYDFVYNSPRTHTVGKADLAVTALDSLTGNVYNGAAYTGSIQSSALGTDTFTVTGMASGIDAGIYSSNLALGGAALANYTTPVITNANLVISPKPVTLTNTARSTIYNGVSSYAALANSTPFTTSAMVGSDAVASVTQTASLSGAAQAGTFTATPNAALMRTGTASNYDFSYVASTYTVDKASLIISAVPNAKIFDGNASALAVPSVLGLKGADTVTNLSEAYADANLGSGKTLNVSSGYLVQDGNGGGNYAVTLVADQSGVIRALPVAILPPSTVVNNTAIALPTLTISSNASGASSSSGAPAGQSSGSSAGVSVSNVQSATQQVTGLVAVMVPAGSATAGTGVVIALAQALFDGASTATVAERVTLPDQQPLPAWIRYDAETKTLSTNAVPAGAFPMMVLVTVGNQATLVQISESQATIK